MRDPIIEELARRAKERARGRELGWSDLARLCGLSRSPVRLWQRVPCRYVLMLERELGVPRHLIRPDIYPPPQESETAPPGETEDTEAA